MELTAPSTGLLDLLKQTTDFPILTDTLSKINNLMYDENASSGELANILKFDPTLSDKILQTVNSVNFAQYGGEISSLTKAVQILGFNKIRTTTINVVLLESIKSDRATDDTKNVTTESFFAGILAKNLLEDVQNADDFIISSVLSDIGKIMLMYHFPDKASALIKEDPEVFGDLSKELAFHWNIPENFTVSMPEKLRTAISVAKEITITNRLKSVKERIFALKTLIEKHASSFSISKIKKLLLDSIAEFRERSKYSLVTLTDLAVIKKLTEISEAPAILDNSDLKVAPSESEIQAILAAGLSLTKEATTSEDLKKLIATLYRALNADTAVFMSYNATQLKFAPTYSIGYDDASKEYLKFPINESSIMGESARSERMVHVADAVFSKEALNVPVWYQNAGVMNSILCVPVAHNNKRLGMLILGSKYKDMLKVSTSHLPHLITFIRWVVTKSAFK